MFLFSNQVTSSTLLWSKATTRNPNSTSDTAGQLVTVADGYPDGTQGTFYMFDRVGTLKWTHTTKNMSWPMQILRNATGTAAGSDDSCVYYFA